MQDCSGITTFVAPPGDVDDARARMTSVLLLELSGYNSMLSPRKMCAKLPGSRRRRCAVDPGPRSCTTRCGQSREPSRCAGRRHRAAVRRRAAAGTKWLARTAVRRSCGIPTSALSATDPRARRAVQAPLRCWRHASNQSHQEAIAGRAVDPPRKHVRSPHPG